MIGRKRLIPSGPWVWVKPHGGYELIGAEYGAAGFVIDDGSADGEYEPRITPSSPIGKALTLIPEMEEALNLALKELERLGAQESSHALSMVRAVLKKFEDACYEQE